MAASARLRLIVSLIFGICIFQTILEVDGHIFVYQYTLFIPIEVANYNDTRAQFGPSNSYDRIEVFAILALPDEEACKEISPPPAKNYPANAKFAAIIKRAGFNCTFETQVRNAQEAHFDAVIIYNSESDELEHMSAQNSSGILIPSVFVGRSTGINLKSYLTPDSVLVIYSTLDYKGLLQLVGEICLLMYIWCIFLVVHLVCVCIEHSKKLRIDRLHKGLLKKLPIIKFTKNTDVVYDTCVICLEEFVEGDKLRVLPCKHTYHSDCIDIWLIENNIVCPICKRTAFSKGQTQSQRNQQSSLVGITDTDDDWKPLSQEEEQQSSINSSITAMVANHGTFLHNNATNTEGGAEGDVTSDGENMLSPARRMNPFDRSPNLPPHLAAQLNRETRTRSIWSWPILRMFRRPITVSVAAPPYVEDALNDVTIA